MIMSSVSVNAELLKNFKLSGELDLQGTAGENVKDFSTHGNAVGAGKANNDRIGSMQTILLVNADWDVLDDVHAKVTLGKNDRTWGTNGNDAYGHNGNGAVGGQQAQSITGAAAGGVLGTVYVDQAYVKIDKVFGGVDTTLGRQFYGSQGDLVAYFGPRLGILGAPITSLDAARFDWASDMIGVTGLVGKQTGSALGATGAADVDLRALIATLKSGDMFKGNVYVYDQVTHAIGASGVGATGFAATPNGLNNNLWLAGLRGQVNMGMACAKAEFDKNFGDDRTGSVTSDRSTYTGWAAKLDLGAKADAGVATVSPWGDFTYATGQGDKKSSHDNAFTPIAGDYHAGDIYTRFNNLSAQPLAGGVAGAGAAGVGQNNLSDRVIWGLGLKVTPGMLNKLTAGIGYWDYRTQTSATPTANGGTAAFAGNKHIGSEADVNLTWKHSENVSFNTGLGRFWAGGAINEAAQSTVAGNANANSGQGVNPATAEWFDVNIKF